MSSAATFTIVCDGHEPKGRMIASVPLDRHTDNPPDLPEGWRHIQVRIPGPSGEPLDSDFDVCSPGCGERAVGMAVRQAYGQDPAQRTPRAIQRDAEGREWVSIRDNADEVRESTPWATPATAATHGEHDR